MKSKDKPGSKISTTQTNTNQKKPSNDPQKMDIGTSVLKKNEFTLIIAGALVVTIIVFFVFFKSSGPKTETLPGLSSTAGSTEFFVELEKRIGAIESALKNKPNQLDPENKGSNLLGSTEPPAELAPLQQKVQRIETSASVKFDSLTERMGKMEKQIRLLNKKLSALPAKVKAAPLISPKKTANKKIAKKPTSTTAKKAAIFHTVRKGETLWSISKKYNTSVANLRKLNNMSEKAAIYPGTNILVR